MADTAVTRQDQAAALVARIKATPLDRTRAISPQDDPTCELFQGEEPMTAPGMPPSDPPEITWPLTPAPEGEPLDPTPGRKEFESLVDFYKRNPSLVPKPKQLPMPPGESPDSEPATWKLRGKPGTDSLSGGGLILGYSSNLRPELDVRVRASRKLIAEREEYRESLVSRFRNQVLMSLEGSAEFRHHQNLAPQYRAACQAATDAQISLNKLQAQLTALHTARPVPENLAAQLVSVQADIVKARNQVEQTAAQKVAITPLYLRARAAVDDIVDGLAQFAWRKGNDQHDTEITLVYEDFLAKNAELLTRMCAMLSGRKGLPQPAAVGLARQVVEEALKAPGE